MPSYGRDNTVNFDSEERFRLALHASAQRDPHSCMAHLKELLRTEPQHAGALHLLAIQYSQLGLPERAIDTLKQTLAIAPCRDIARLHLGLILIDRQRDVEALEEFRELETSPNEPMRLCAQAMAAAAAGDRELAAEKLELASSDQTENPSLTLLVTALRSKLSGDSVAAG